MTDLLSLKRSFSSLTLTPRKKPKPLTSLDVVPPVTHRLVQDGETPLEGAGDISPPMLQRAFSCQEPRRPPPPPVLSATTAAAAATTTTNVNTTITTAPVPLKYPLLASPIMAKHLTRINRHSLRGLKRKVKLSLKHLSKDLSNYKHLFNKRLVAKPNIVIGSPLTPQNTSSTISETQTFEEETDIEGALLYLVQQENFDPQADLTRLFLQLN